MLHYGPTRAERIEREELIDVDEWAELRGVASPLPFAAALTRALWDVAIAVPFAAVGAISRDERVSSVLSAAANALRIATDPPLCFEPELGFTASFGAMLPVRACEPRWRPLRLLCAPDAGRIVITIGLAGEIKARPPRSRP
jgi:hypothetical protein